MRSACEGAEDPCCSLAYWAVFVVVSSSSPTGVTAPNRKGLKLLEWGKVVMDFLS